MLNIQRCLTPARTWYRATRNQMGPFYSSLTSAEFRPNHLCTASKVKLLIVHINSHEEMVTTFNFVYLHSTKKLYWLSNAGSMEIVIYFSWVCIIHAVNLVEKRHSYFSKGRKILSKTDFVLREGYSRKRCEASRAGVSLHPDLYMLQD